jgi:hypothetical protein
MKAIPRVTDPVLPPILFDIKKTTPEKPISKPATLFAVNFSSFRKIGAIRMVNKGTVELRMAAIPDEIDFSLQEIKANGIATLKNPTNANFQNHFALNEVLAESTKKSNPSVAKKTLNITRVRGPTSRNAIFIQRKEDPQINPRKRNLSQFLADNGMFLQIQEPCFGFDTFSGRITGESSVCGNHPVTWDQNGHRISAESRANCPAGSGLAQHFGDLTIGEHLAKRDIAGQVKDILLKTFNVTPVEGKIKGFPLSREIFGHLFYGFS